MVLRRSTSPVSSAELGHPAPEQRRTSGFRPDIQGLRAFAVLLVVLDHLKLWPHGGFVGVDVFFTISGFLITGLIIDEITRTGRFSIKNFYVRRARRILPAAIAALLGTWIVARFVFNSVRVDETVHDIWWSLGFAANINLANSGTDYFATYQQPSLVQHFWSLAVEEQFYLVWPLLLLAVALWANRRGAGRAGRRLGTVAAATVTASFVWCVVQTGTDPSAAYFSSPGRAWELGAGALIALAARQGMTLPRRLAGPASFIGVVGIVLSAAVIDQRSTFPGPAALVPVLAGVLVLAAGCGAPVITAWHVPLINKAARYIGLVSFSLYLWHWPTIQVVDALVSPDAAIYYPLVISAMATVTLISYYAIELPFHEAGRASAAELRRHLPGAGLWSRTSGRRAVVVTAMALCTVTFWVFRPGPAVPPAALVGNQQSTTTEPVSSSGATLRLEIADALHTTAWPALSPSLDEVVAARTVNDGLGNCAVVASELPPADACSWGSPTASKIAYVLGDSTAEAYMEIFRHLPESGATDWQVRFIGMAGCTFVDVRIDNPVAPVAQACPSRKLAAVDLIQQTNPDLVIVTSNYTGQIDADTGNLLPLDEWAAGLQRFTDRYRNAAKDVVFLAPPPVEKDIQTCYTALSVPADCISTVTPSWSGYATAVRSIATTEQAHYVDSTPWFCSSGLCPAFVGNTPTKRDVVHMTVEYADRIAPVALETLAADGLLT